MKIERSVTTSKSGKRRVIIKLSSADGWSETKIGLVTKLLQLLPRARAENPEPGTGPIDPHWAEVRGLVREMEAAGVEADVLRALGDDS